LTARVDEKSNTLQPRDRKKEISSCLRDLLLWWVEMRIEAAVKDIINKTEEKAQAEAEKAVAEEELEATEEFFGNAAGTCRARAGEWKKRTMLRSEELQGISKALEILTSVRSHAGQSLLVLFTKAMATCCRNSPALKSCQCTWRMAMAV